MLLTECEYINFGKNNNNVGSTFYNDFCSFKKQLIQTSKSVRLKWNLKNEIRYCSKTATSIEKLRNSFGEISKEQK